MGGHAYDVIHRNTKARGEANPTPAITDLSILYPEPAPQANDAGPNLFPLVCVHKLVAVAGFALSQYGPPKLSTGLLGNSFVRWVR